MYSDPIADYLTRIRNALMAKQKVVNIPGSSLKRDITKLLYDKGYIQNFKFEEDDKQGIIKIALKYHSSSSLPVIKDIQRVSRPGLRQYRGSKELPRILNGLGVAVLSTSKGVMTDKEARKENVGGEVICYVH